MIVRSGGMRTNEYNDNELIPMYGAEVWGLSEEVNELGITASYYLGKGDQVRTFYPWRAVLSLRSKE